MCEVVLYHAREAKAFCLRTYSELISVPRVVESRNSSIDRPYSSTLLHLPVPACRYTCAFCFSWPDEDPHKRGFQPMLSMLRKQEVQPPRCTSATAVLGWTRGRAVVRRKCSLSTSSPTVSLNTSSPTMSLNTSNPCQDFQQLESREVLTLIAHSSTLTSYLIPATAFSIKKILFGRVKSRRKTSTISPFPPTSDTVGPQLP